MQNKYISTWLFLSIVLFFSSHRNLNAQFQKENVVKANSFSISSDEFKKRFEFSPHPGSNKNFDSSSTKRDFMLTLIAEKLLAKKAVEERLNKSNEYQSAYNYTRNLYLRDALYKTEVKDKVVIPDSELAKGKKKVAKTLFTKFIFSRAGEEINNLYESLTKGASFDSILSTRSENKEQKNAEEITFGKMNEKMEDALFKLNPGEFTRPVELKEGWYICKVYSVSQKGSLEDTDYSKMDNVIRERIENKLYEKFYKKYFEGIKINADTRLFNLLNDVLTKYLLENRKRFIAKNGKYTLFSSEIAQLRKQIDKKEFEIVFIKFPVNPVTLAEFMEFMSIEGFDFISYETKAIRSRLNSYVANFIQNEILAREAFKRGYEKLPDVENELRLWRENYLASLMMKKTFNQISISDEEAYSFYAKNNKILQHPDELKIAEILVSDLDVIKNIYTELDKGADFNKLVYKYSLHDSTTSSKMMNEFCPMNKEDEIWKIANGLKIGEIYGPIKTKEGYSVIKLLDKKEGIKEQVELFENAKADIKSILRSDKMLAAIESESAKLALDEKVEINQKILDEIKVNTVNMIVFRRFGFGGQQIAVPYLQDLSKWFKVYEKMRKSLSF